MRSYKKLLAIYTCSYIRMCSYIFVESRHRLDFVARTLKRDLVASLAK